MKVNNPFTPEPFKTFLDVWGNAEMARNIAPQLTCGELEALTDLLVALDAEPASAVWEALHAVGKPAWDRHFVPRATEIPTKVEAEAKVFLAEKPKPQPKSQPSRRRRSRSRRPVGSSTTFVPDSWSNLAADVRYEASRGQYTSKKLDEV